jgi:ubiquinone biosynthesis protein
MGRFKDGTLLVTSDAMLGKDTPDNDFDYSHDRDGTRCPYSSHIRKMNDRIASRYPNIARCSMMYGVRPDLHENGKMFALPEKGVGMLFMCYQKNIARGFEGCNEPQIQHTNTPTARESTRSFRNRNYAEAELCVRQPKEYFRGAAEDRDLERRRISLHAQHAVPQKAQLMKLVRAIDAAKMCVWFFHVGFELCRGALAYGICRDREWRYPRSSYRHLSSSSLADTLERLGPICTKVGQILASRPDLLGDEICSRLKRLQNRIKPIAFSTVCKIIERNFGSSKLSGLDWVEPEPIAAGLIAQVHRARTRDGAQIVLKVLRPDVRRRMSLDFMFMRIIAVAFDRLRLFPSLQAANLVREVEYVYLQQMDFLSECDNAKVFLDNFRDWSQVIIPRIIHEYTCADVLAMEYVPAFDSRRLVTPGISAVGLRMFYKMIFVDGFVHADLHSGNVVFDASCVYLTDFGLVARLDEVSRTNFRDLFVAIATRNSALCAEIILKFSE